jgi:hypothetical protein
MRAACALVDNAAGQTAMEALSSGLPVIGYRPIPGHGADGVRLMADLGLSDYARDENGLLDSLRRLAAPSAARQRRIAAGRAVFRTGAISPLTNLGSPDPAQGRRGVPGHEPSLPGSHQTKIERHLAMMARRPPARGF